MKIFSTLAITLITGFFLPVSAQNYVRAADPYKNLTHSEKSKLQEQALGIFSAIKPSVKKLAKSTVTIGNPWQRLGFGVAVHSPHFQKTIVLTKWSEIANYRSRLFITNSEGQKINTQVVGVYTNHDLALLSLEENHQSLTPIDFTQGAEVQLGDFITLARHNGRAEGFGVVSVLPRSLQEKSKGYLGVQMSFKKHNKRGVFIDKVLPKSAAAMAGLNDGDQLLAINQTTISGPVQMRNVLQKLSPGEKIDVTYKRHNLEETTMVILGSRADDKRLQSISTERMNHMERMGTDVNFIRSNFPNVIQSDMAVNPNDTGAAAININGEVIGINIARASRIKTYIIPSSTIHDLLQSRPISVEQALYGKRR